MIGFVVVSRIRFGIPSGHCWAADIPDFQRLSTGDIEVNGDIENLTGLSVEELEALADSVLAPTAQSRLEELLTRQKAKLLSVDDERQLDLLLQKVDNLTIIKTRARYTLNRQRIAATGT